MENNTSAVIPLVVLVVSAFLLIFFKHARSSMLRSPKHAEEQSCSKDNGSVFRILAPSAFGICICAVCLCGSSWAWFTAAMTTDVATIQTATYTASVDATQGETKLSATTAKDGATEFALEAGKDYVIAISPTGTATSGYCKVHFEDKDYYTEQLTSGSFSFTVHASKNSTLIVAPQWGTCAVANSGNTIGNSAELGTPQASSASAASANAASPASTASAPAAAAEADSTAGSAPDSASANPSQAAAAQETTNGELDNSESSSASASSNSTAFATEASAKESRG